jgi:hypothetical protein
LFLVSNLVGACFDSVGVAWGVELILEFGLNGLGCYWIGLQSQVSIRDESTTSTDLSLSTHGPSGGYDDQVSDKVEGPWGSNEETTFYDGNGNITEIEVAFNKQYIVRVQTTFILNGMTFKQAPRGGSSGDVSKVSNLWRTPFLWL